MLVVPQAGFEDPATEIEKRLAEKAQTAETVKDFLGRIQPLTSAEYHAALSDALAQVEAETNSSVTMDSASEGYKKFAAKVQVRTAAARYKQCLDGMLAWPGHQCPGRLLFGRWTGAASGIVGICNANDIAFYVTLRVCAKAVATANKIPAKLLVDAKKGSTVRLGSGWGLA